MNSNEIMDTVQINKKDKDIVIDNLLHERKRESRGQRFRRQICAALSVILVVSMVSSGKLQYVEPSVVLAKESFSGIGKIVEEHDDGDPYVILDIVPGIAVYNDSYPFSLGTMGYLVDGQAPIIDDIANIFCSNTENFYSYKAREDFVKDVTVYNSELGMTYEERYLGVDFDEDNIPSGWMQMFSEKSMPESGDEGDERDEGGAKDSGTLDDNTERGTNGEDSGDSAENDTDGEAPDEDADSDADSPDYATGQFRGTAIEVDESEGDYILLSEYKKVQSFGINNNIGAVEPFYIHNDSHGDYRVNFAPMDCSGEGIDGYVIVDEVDLDSASETSSVYWIDDEGVYHLYGCTIADILGHSYGSIVVEGDDDQAGDGGNIGIGDGTVNGIDTDIDDTDDTEDIENTDDTEDTDNTDDTYDIDDVDDDLTFSDDWRLFAENGEDKDKDEAFRKELGQDYKERYRVLAFQYVSNSSAEDRLYWPDDRIELDVEPGTPYPYDSYDLSSSEDEEFPVSQSENRTDPEKYVYVGPGNGKYKLERTDISTDTLIEVYDAPVFFRVTAGKDWLKQYVFCTLDDGDNDNNDFEIDVRTVTADEVSDDDVGEADLIFLESGFNNVVFNTEASGMKVNYISKNDGDIQEEVLSRILSRAVEDLMPVIVDYDIVKKGAGHYEESNYRHLAKAFLDDFPEKDEDNFNYVNQNVYVVNGSPLVNGDFYAKLESDAGFKDVIRAIKAENTTLPEDELIDDYVSKARAIQYIINFSVDIIGDFDDLKVLEIQPSANTKSDLHREDGNRKLTWRTDDMETARQILYSNDEFDVSIDTKSVVEFNGEWEDINGIYDFIFIGLDGQRLNRDDDDGGTLYNNEDLDGKVYHRGDSSDKGDYDANDLTTQKMEDLLDYMAAGYPVLVEDNCFDGWSAQNADDEDDINTHYIDDDTNMYRFLKSAVENDRYEDCIFTVSDVKAGTMFMTKVSLEKPRVRMIEADDNDQVTSETASAAHSLVLDENNEYHGQLGYRITNNHDEDEDYSRDATVRVYVDYNYDGHFADAEQVTECTNVNNVLDIRIAGMGHGVLPWKLEVSDAYNAYRRDSAQGYFLLSGTLRNEIKVLQITENRGDPAYDLQLMFRQDSDASVLGYYLKSAESALNADLQFESVNARQLEERLEDNSGYLEQWDVVVLTLDGAVDSPAVATAINEYAAGGRSLLVCGQDPGDQRAGLSGSLLGQTDSRTFVDLGLDNASEYKRYADLDNNMFRAQTGLKAEEVNGGIISMYPFSISNTTVDFGSSTALKASPYLLELENRINSDAEDSSFVTVWYTLGGSADTAYGISPKDARNNYYCYSKGSVVYLAQSRYEYTYNAQNGNVSDTDDGAEECRFFVNALTAAYSAGLHNASVNIVSGFSPDAADIQTISVPFDEVWPEMDPADPTAGMLDNTVDVYFKFRDNNFASHKTAAVGFYYEDENGEKLLTVDGKQKRGTPFPTDIWTVIDNRLVQVEEGKELVSGKIYRIEAPVIPLQNNTNPVDHERADKADIYVVLETTFIRGGRSYEITSVDSVSLNRARLFLLE